MNASANLGTMEQSVKQKSKNVQETPVSWSKLLTCACAPDSLESVCQNGANCTEEGVQMASMEHTVRKKLRNVQAALVRMEELALT